MRRRLISAGLYGLTSQETAVFKG